MHGQALVRRLGRNKRNKKQNAVKDTRLGATDIFGVQCVRERLSDHPSQTKRAADIRTQTNAPIPEVTTRFRTPNCETKNPALPTNGLSFPASQGSVIDPATKASAQLPRGSPGTIPIVALEKSASQITKVTPRTKDTGRPGDQGGGV